uniref:Protein BIG GRAIN 1-like n=1 Tax=Oryza punctata TaxID=4537 RepID=A0A0E0M7D8_ORYPU
MEMRWAAPAPAARPIARARRRAPDQPSFSSTLLDAICDSMDEGGEESRPRNAASAGAKKRQEAANSYYYYYYKPSLAASYRAAAAPAQGSGGGAGSPADFPGRGYFSSSEVEYSLRRLRPIRTSAAGGVGDGAAIARKQQQQPDVEKTTRTAKTKPASVSASACRRPASPGARLASLLNSIFSGKRPSTQRPACSPDHSDPACLTAPPPSSYARPCLAKTPHTPTTTTARARASRSRTVRFLDIDGKVAVAAAVAGCRRIPVMEVEADTDGGEESSDASSDLFELDNLASIAPAGGRGGSYGDELPVYGTTGVGIRRDIGRRRPYGYAPCRSWSRAV